MPGRGQVSLRELQKKIRNNGFVYVRSKGSHHIYKNGNKVIVLPVNTKGVSDNVVHQINRICEV